MNQNDQNDTVCLDPAYLNRLYDRLNRRRYVYPDPLIFLYEYPETRDREIVALIAASLAYGRVQQILISVRRVLTVMGGHPCEFLCRGNKRVFAGALQGFVHRFARETHMVGLFCGMKKILQTHGSLQECFLAAYNPNEASVQPALSAFVQELLAGCCGSTGHLLPDPARGSACKRLHLFLRWMVRKDRVDPGGWASVAPAQLIMPLDVHIFRICRDAGWVRRCQPSLSAALEITDRFKKINAADPVRYDFVLSRLGIRKDIGTP